MSASITGAEYALWAYRLLLGREPEDPEALRNYLETSRQEILERFLNSREFLGRNVFRTDSPGTWVLAEIRPGLRLWVDLRDMWVSRLCLLGAYEPTETAFIENFLHPGMAFVDIGANIGWYSIIAAKIVGLSGLVYSFEPRPNTCNYLRRSISENRFSQVNVFQLALSDASGSLPIATFGADKNPGGTWLLTTASLQAS